LGEPTTNLLPNGVAAVHDAASGNAVTVTDATTEKGPGWKKVTITARGSNFRTLQWTYLSMSANVTYTFSAVFDWGNMRGKNYFIFFDGDGTGGRTYYRPGDYTNAGSELINSTMPDGKFAGKILHSDTHTHSFFIGNSTTGVSGLNDYFYYKEFQAEAKSHPTQFTTGTRSNTQGLLDIAGRSEVNLLNVSFDSNAQMTFDGTNDGINILPGSAIFTNSSFAVEAVLNYTNNSQNQVYFSTGAPISANGGIHLRIYPTNGQLRMGFYFDDLDTPTGVTAPNKFQHIVMQYDYNSDTSRIYVNGEQKATSSRGPYTPGTSAPTVGYAPSPYSEYFQGELPIMKIYNRALTADEVQRNFNAVKSRFNIA